MDVEDVSRISVQQLADYVAMVSLAQIDPHADAQAYVSILNVFDQSDMTEALADLDLAHLRGLYNAQQNPTNRIVSRSDIKDAIKRAHRQLTAEENTPL